MGNNVFATILAYRTDAFEGKGKEPPKTWVDLFDVKKFPGRRSMRKHPFDTIEQALLADGVPREKLYPLDFDRAFKKLDTIKKDIAVWWTGGAQTSQLLKSGEVDICACWNARAQAAIDDGAPVKLIWDPASVDTGRLVDHQGYAQGRPVPRVRQVLRSIPARQAIFTKHLAYGPTHPDAYKTIPAERAKVLPTAPALPDEPHPGGRSVLGCKQGQGHRAFQHLARELTFALPCGVGKRTIPLLVAPCRNPHGRAAIIA